MQMMCKPDWCPLEVGLYGIENSLDEVGVLFLRGGLICAS